MQTWGLVGGGSYLSLPVYVSHKLGSLSEHNIQNKNQQVSQALSGSHL
jgi:hypothetical protein